MTDGYIKFKLLRNIFRFAPSFVLFLIVTTIIWQVQKPPAAYQYKRKFTCAPSFFYLKKYSADEKRIAEHFAADTLPGLMRRGLIRKYLRDVSGTSIAVNRNLWKQRSKFFKTSLLTEISVFNKVQGYEISVKIIDDLSGKMYACISPEAKMDFYN